MITLGIDYGTTKNAVVVFDNMHPEDYIAVSAPHHAEMPDADHPAFAQQDMRKVYDAILALINQIPADTLARVEAIGFTGQMHSVIAWNDSGDMSPVVTWQDKRASAAGRLDSFRALTGLPLADGFGGVTLADMAACGTLAKWTHAASPVDWLAANFCSKTTVCMEPTFAASWGIWNIRTNDWNHEALRILRIPESILPLPVESASVIGCTKGVPGLADGIPVLASLGDNQASVFGTASVPEKELFLTLGTGAQFSMVLSADEIASFRLPDGVELRPFIDGNFLAVNAPLCGGRAWAWLAQTVNGFLGSLGLAQLDEKALMDSLDAMALDFKRSPQGEEPLTIEPEFLGRRNAPDARASVTGINLANFTLPAVASALGAGIVRQLIRPFPMNLISSRSCVVGSGNCVRFCKSIQEEIRCQSGLPLSLSNLREEAALGVAKLAARQNS